MEALGGEHAWHRFTAGDFEPGAQHVMAGHDRFEGSRQRGNVEFAF